MECAPEGESGGNSRFTAGAIRVAYEGVEDLRALMPDLSEEEIENTDFGKYTREQFFDDMARVTEYRANPDLVELLVGRSMDTLQWMRRRQSYRGGNFVERTTTINWYASQKCWGQTIYLHISLLLQNGK